MRGAKDAPLLRSVRGYAQHMCAALLLSLVGLAHAQSPAPCSPTLGRVVSLQGSIELLRSGSASWQRLTRLDTPVCRGDQLRAGLLSRAAMYISPETLVRLDQNTTLELVDQTATETVLRFHQDDFTRKLAAQSNFCGVGYFITRFPRKLRVRTPFYNAVVEGTEFQVAMTCDRGELVVFEGKVAAESVTASGERVLLESGQSTSVGIGETPTAIKTIVKPSDAVQWALYYLPLTDVSLLSDAALEQNCAQLSVELRSGCLIRRAEYLLRVGRAQEARAELSGLLLAEPNNGDVLALQSIIAVVQNDKPAALGFAQRAIDAAPNSFRPYAALSYALQANFQLEEALNAAKRASDLAPDSALLRARNAELQLSLGRVRSAEREAIEAVRLNANESRAHLILGFVHLARIDTKKATADFNTAIELDSTEPLARLGLGLATIREGRLEEGREQIEIAVALDPTNSLVRSYVGKAYYEENSKARDQLAATQFGLAKSLDPNDPTPWFYDAILKQTQNRPVEALEDLQKSIELNDNRAVYRSRLSLDSDHSSRSANRSAFYGDLGFTRLAVRESTDALAGDYTNHAAHRTLAESYAELPRYDTARVSEALQAQIWQPVGAPWTSPLLAADKLALSRSIVPDQISAYEYSSLFDRAQAGLRADVLAGTRDTWANQLVLHGVSERFAFTANQLHYQTDGFRENNAAEKDTLGAFVNAQVTSRLAVQLIGTGSTYRIEDTPFDFFPVTIRETSELYRANVRFDANEQVKFIVSAAQERQEGSVTTIPDELQLVARNSHLRSIEGQSVVSTHRARFISGAAFVEQDDDFEDPSHLDTDSFSIYGYGLLSLLDDQLTVEAGLALEQFESRSSFFPDAISDSQVNPKVGLVWTLRPGTKLRLARTSSIRRVLPGGQTLEPTQVAGLNQFFTGYDQFYGDVPGTRATRTGAALDHAFTRSTSAGVEWAERKLEVPDFFTLEHYTWREQSALAYVYHRMPDFLPAVFGTRTQAALSADLEYEKLLRPQILTGPEAIISLETWRAPLALRVHPNSFFTLEVATAWVKQSGQFSLGIGAPVSSIDNEAWLTDLIATVRLPRRGGFVTLGVRNIMDDDIDLIETDPLNPRFATRRIMFVNLSLSL